MIKLEYLSLLDMISALRRSNLSYTDIHCHLIENYSFNRGSFRQAVEVVKKWRGEV